MALTKGSGPFGTQPGGVFNRPMPEYRGLIYFEDSPRRMRAVFSGETVVDSSRAKLLHEHGHLPVYYFPEEDVRMDLLEPTDHSTTCPWKGEASYWSVRVGDRVAENAVWSYLDPLEDAPPLEGYYAFYWNEMDEWYEEDEPAIVHARDPYHRVDILESSRHVKVSLGRRDSRGDHPRARAVRDRPAHALVLPRRGRAQRSARAERPAYGLRRTRASRPTGPCARATSWRRTWSGPTATRRATPPGSRTGSRSSTSGSSWRSTDLSAERRAQSA